MYDAIFIEERKKPAIVLAYEPFANDARSASSGKGMPSVRFVTDTVVSECTVAEEIQAGVSGALDNIIAALTKPLTKEELNPVAKPKETLNRIIFKGSIFEVNQFLFRRGWTDGLPVLPPTEEAIAEMLTGTDLSPDHCFGKLGPRYGKATVEKVAINAVMAGALPIHLPLLLTLVDSMTKNPASAMMACSTGSFAPFLIINGPMRKELHINSYYGAFSPGDIGNAAIGRAVGLIVKNIRGTRKGIEDMGVLGNPAKYTMVVAENEEESPWEPLHVEQGYKKEDSTVTLNFIQSYQQVYSYGTDDLGLLNTFASNIAPGQVGVPCFMLPPTNARAIAKRGWNKQDIRKFIAEHATVTKAHHPNFYASQGSDADLNESVPLFPGAPGKIPPLQIFVAGGMGSWTGIISGGQPTTLKIEKPKNWGNLVLKYQNVVPKYAPY